MGKHVSKHSQIYKLVQLNGRAFDCRSRGPWFNSVCPLDKIFFGCTSVCLKFPILDLFTLRYGGKKLERTRDLFEQCLETCPEQYAKPIFLLYAKLEEQHGLARRAMAGPATNAILSNYWLLWQIIDLPEGRINDPSSGRLSFTFFPFQQLPHLSLGPFKGLLCRQGAL